MTTADEPPERARIRSAISLRSYRSVATRVADWCEGEWATDAQRRELVELIEDSLTDRTRGDT